MIRQLHVVGYKSLHDLTLTMRPLRILVGPNAAGKSNVVDALRILSEVVQSDVTTVLAPRGGLSTVAFMGSPERKFELVLDYVLDHPDESDADVALRYAIAIGERDGVAGVASETLSEMKNGIDEDGHSRLRAVWGKGAVVTERNGRRTLGFDADPPGGPALRMFGLYNDYPSMRALKEWLASWRFLSIDLRRVREPRYDERSRTLTSDASNLANVLRTIQGEPIFVQILEDLQSLFGDVNEITTELDRGRVRLLLRERSFTDPIDALALSDGTLRLLAICTALATTPDHGLLCIEEPEHGLHPLLFGPLLDTIRQRCPKDGTRQVLLTTHAPDLLDVAEPSEVAVVERDADGATLLRELDGPKLARWLQDFRLGEFWQMRQLGGVPE